MSKYDKDCWHMMEPGSYYDPLPWTECRKQPADTSFKTFHMCQVTEGESCPFAKGKEANK